MGTAFSRPRNFSPPPSAKFAPSRSFRSVIKLQSDFLLPIKEITLKNFVNLLGVPETEIWRNLECKQRRELVSTWCPAGVWGLRDNGGSCQMSSHWYNKYCYCYVSYPPDRNHSGHKPCNRQGGLCNKITSSQPSEFTLYCIVVHQTDVCAAALAIDNSERSYLWQLWKFMK